MRDLWRLRGLYETQSSARDRMAKEKGKEIEENGELRDSGQREDKEEDSEGN
jgi:hypothetical protein